MPRRISEDYLKRMRERYENAPRRVKTQILSEFCANSGYSRKHGSRIVSGKIRPRTHRPGPKVKYGPEVIFHLKVLWEAMNRICSKKMKAALPLWLEFYKDAPEGVKAQLKIMAASTIDKKLNPYRGPNPKGKSTTRGLKMMMNRIPLKLIEGEVVEPDLLR